MLYRMALYHLWELATLYRPRVTQPLEITRALLNLWTEVIHLEFQLLRTDPARPCDCAFCVPPPPNMFTPSQFWNAWGNVMIEGCACPVCAIRRCSPAEPPQPHLRPQTHPQEVAAVSLLPPPMQPMVPPTHHTRIQLAEQGKREFLGQSLADPTQFWRQTFCLEAKRGYAYDGPMIQTSQEHPESDRLLIKVGTLVYSLFLLFFLLSAA